MAEERLLTVRDVSLILGISEKEVTDLVEGGQIPAYKIGGEYLRFKPQQIDEFRKHHKTFSRKDSIERKYSLRDKISDFFYFNDFYILSAILILLILFIVFHG
jgi:excisionase family DNA binding protein